MKTQWALSWIIISFLIIGVLIGLITWIFSDNQTLSLITGMVTFVLLFCISIWLDLRFTHQKLVNMLLDISPIGKLVLKSLEIIPSIEHISKMYEEIKNTKDSFLIRRCNDSIRDLENLLEELSAGRFYVSEKDFHLWAREVVNETKKGEKIYATSYIEASRWWDSLSGEQYLKSNMEAVQNGVSITRVFIFDEKGNYEANKELLNKQLEAKINVRYVFTNEIDSELQRDLMVVDDRYAIELVLGPDRKSIIGFHVERSEATIKRFIEMIDRLIRLSKPFTA